MFKWHKDQKVNDGKLVIFFSSALYILSIFDMKIIL